MVSIKTTVLALAAAVAVSADYYINPDSVDPTTRKAWCQQEVSTCPLICEQIPPGSTEVNTCDWETLTYGCVCGNGLQPNVSEYSLTLPYFTCQEFGNQCVAACNGDNICQSKCRDDHPCGALSPKTNYTTTSSTMQKTSSAGPTTTSNQVFNGIPGTSATATSSSDSSSSDKSAATALNIGRSYGLAIVAGGLFAGFALVL